MTVKCEGNAFLPTKFGKFQIYGFSTSDGKEHVALVKGDITSDKNVPVRLHSKCLTGDTFGSKRCDCRDQFESAMKMIGKKKIGVIIYMDQEGRGIGLLNKIKAYALQQEGMDTAEANNKLGFASDLRDYEDAADIIRLLGIKKVAVITNNPEKIKQLKSSGINVVERIPLIMKTNKYSEDYIKTKKQKLGHMID